MTRKIVAVVGAVAFAFALLVATHAAAFQLPWESTPQPSRAKPTIVAQTTHQPAPAGAPEPYEAVPLPSWAPMIKRIMPTVVQVSVVNVIKTSGSPFAGMSEGQGDNGNNGPGFQFPFGQFPGFPQPNQPPRRYKQHGLGSGVIVSPDGYILTNNHVVGKATEIHVTLMDKREFTAKVIGKDQKTDLALIKIDPSKPLAYAQFGDSDQVQVGDWVLAIGNPFGFSLSATTGIVSAKGRALGGNYDEFIQTDAAINPGNSGGPLFNTNGQVVGINTAIYSSDGNNAGIGFAIPSDLAHSVMDQLKAHGHVIRGWLGVEIQGVTPDLAQSFNLAKAEGALVAQVERDTPAAKAGLKRGDVIVTYNGQTVSDEHALPEMVAETAIGTTVPLEVIRDGKHLTLHATVAELHDQQLASAEGPGSPSSWGLGVQTLTPDIAQELGVKGTQGVVISQVRPGSAADEAGLRSGDVILEMDHMKIASADQFTDLARQKSGKSALLLVQRGNATMYTVINPKG